MGMLMHHTWLKQQEAMKAKTAVEEEIPFNEPVTEVEAKATAEAEEPKRETESKAKAPARKPAARRKTSK